MQAEVVASEHRTNASRRRRPFMLAVGVVAASLVMAACSSSSSGGSSGSSSSPSASATSSDAVASAQAAVAVLSKPAVTMTKPTDKVAPGSRKVAVVAVGLATSGASDTAKIVQQAITDAGWTAPPTYDGKFTPTVESGYIQTAITSGASAIILVSVTPSTVASALQLAATKKIPVVCILCGPSSTFSQFPGVIGVEPSPENVGTAQAQWVIAGSNGKANIWVYEDNEFPFTTAQTTAAINTFKGCSGCVVHTVQMKAGDELAPGVPVLAGVLAANPKGTINYIVAPYDGAAAAFSTYLQQKGRTEIQVIGYAALPVFVTQIAAGSPPSAKATVSIPLPYMSYASVDQAARLLAGSATWTSDALGVSLLTTDNVSQYPPNAPWTNPGFDVQSYFKGLWGTG